jgi:hypothetical protein
LRKTFCRMVLFYETRPTGLPSLYQFLVLTYAPSITG